MTLTGASSTWLAPSPGLTQPGMTVVLRRLPPPPTALPVRGFGIGTSQVEHVLATQTLPMAPFKTMAITVWLLPEARRPRTSSLAVIAKIGTGGGQVTS